LIRSHLLAVGVVLLAVGSQAISSLPARASTGNPPTVIQAVAHDTSPPLRTLQASPVAPSGMGNHAHRPLHPGQAGIGLPTAPSSMQTTVGAAAAPPIGTTFEGVNNLDNVLPPDTNGDIGPNDYVQWVNLHFEIFNRSGQSLEGPLKGNTLWSGFGTGTPASVCATTNQGDPVVRYDRMADRWVFTQFAFTTKRNGSLVPPFIQCFAVSTTGDPTGTFNRYAWTISSTYFPDYPKLAVWPDAYYMTVNYFSGNTFVGGGALAFDRSKMLLGQAATLLSYGPLGSAFGGLLPSDLDGSILPPSGSPDYFGAIDTSGTSSGSTFQIWKFHVDFATPANSTFGTATHTPDFNLAVDPYNFDLCSGSRNCIQQPASTQGLDPIADRLMNRLQYRRFADGHESLVANHTVAVVAGGNQAAIRWYEIRNLSTSPTIYQQGTFVPTNDSRWMGSIAMDQAGDIALGYSVSSKTVSPSIRYTGRLASDAPGTLETETTLIAGSGSQTSSSDRWGDYSMMAVDPTDDCTFWYTQEYYQTTSNAGWQTRVGSFKFPNCGAPAAPTNLTASAASASQINLSWTASISATTYSVQRSPNGTSSWIQVGTTSTTSFSDTGLSAATTYYYEVLAVNSAGNSGPSNVVSATTMPAAPTNLSATAASASQINLSWTGSTGASSYVVQRSPTGNSSWTQIGTTTATSFNDTGLNPASAYYYEVLASNTSGNSTPSNVASAVTMPAPPMNLTATAVSASQIYLGWTASTGATTYTVQRSPDGTSSWTQLITTTATSYSDTGLTAGTTYFYQALATNTSGDSTPSNVASATTVPPAPTNLAATAVSTSQINLSWTGSKGATSYIVQRSPDGITWTQVGTATATSFSDASLSAGTTYDYEVLASNAAGNSAPSNMASATTQLAYNQSPQGNWVGNYGADGYGLLGWNGSSDLVSLPQSTLILDQGARYSWSSGTSDVRALASPDASTRRATCWYQGSELRLHLAFPSAYSGTLHIYAIDWDSTSRRESITIDDGNGPRTANLLSDFSQGVWINLPISVAVSGTLTITVDRTAGANAVLSGLFLGVPSAPPAAPTGLTATPASASQINLAWSGVSGANGYQVERSPDGSTGWNAVGTPTSPSFSDLGLTASTTYYYRVEATNVAGTSTPSGTASATTNLAVSQAPQGSWVGSYGTNGYDLLGWNGTTDLTSLPADATASLTQGARWTWASSTSDGRALQSPDASSRRASCVYASGTLTLQITFTSGYTGTLHLYAVDYDSTTRRQTVYIGDSNGQRQASLSSDFSQGAWITAPITVATNGTLTITVNSTAGANAVLSGLFLG